MCCCSHVSLPKLGKALIKNKEKNPTELFWIQFNTLLDSQQHLWLLIQSLCLNLARIRLRPRF